MFSRAPHYCVRLASRFSARPFSSSLTFSSAQTLVKTLKQEPSNEEKLQLYALFKQATLGKNTTPKPSMLDFVGGHKWSAWNKLSHLSTDAAEKEYVALVSKLSGGGASPSAPSSTTTTTSSSSTPTAPASPPRFTLPSGAGQPLVFRAPLDPDSGIEAIILNAPPVNALSSEVMGALTAALQAASRDTSVRGLILASSHPGLFSGGLDIREMAGANEATFGVFWGQVQALFMALYPLNKPIVAALEGAAPAGGCWMALQCDHRVVVDEPKAVIGLNEVALGIVAPPWFSGPLTAAVGQRRGESMLQLATLLPPKAALEWGVVDEVVGKGRVVDAAVAAAARYAAMPSNARHLSKMSLRHELLQSSLGTPEIRAQDLKRTWEFFTTPEVQEGLRIYLERLSQRKK